MKRLLALFLAFAGPSVISFAQTAGDGVFQKFDKNADGKVTTGELANPAAFERYDLDKDGAVSLAEYNQVSGKTSPATPGTPAPPATPGTPSAPGGMAGQIEQIIKTVDKNADGRITKEEAGDAPWFARVDRNADGVIDTTELETVRKLAARGGGGAGVGRGMPANAPTITPEEVAAVTSGPEMLKPGEVGIGRMIPDLSFTTLDGGTASLGGFKDKTGLVIIMTSATCPVSKRYIPSVATLEKELAGQNLGLLLVNPFASETADEIKAQISAAGITAAYVHDAEKKLSALLQSRTTTEVFLLDAARTLAHTEGIIPALESAHAVAEAIRIAPESGGRLLLVNLSGRGDKDTDIYRENLPELDAPI